MPYDFGADDGALPLTRRLNGPDFSQQGQVDWVSLSKSTINFSLGVLSRLSAASIDPYTLTIGHYIGGSFELSRTGRKNLTSALSQLKAFSSVGEVLWFGFGIKNVVRSISVTEEGATLVALCAALSECFPEDLAAEILAAILKAKGGPTPSPAVSEWQNLVRACSGVFSATPFPIRAETLMGMYDLSKDLDIYAHYPDPKSMANALIGVGNVSRGIWTSISVIGNREAGWLAALAEWLFGLTVTITDADREIKYSSCSSPFAQLNVRYASDMSASKSSLINITEKTYELRSAMEFLQPSRGNFYSENVAPFGGRVPCDNLLSVVFDHTFQRLTQMGDVVGQIVGSAARLFEGIAFAAPGIPDYYLWQNESYSDKSIGKGFVEHVLTCLPELSFAATSMRSSTVVSYEEAVSAYSTNFNLLSSSCGCHGCKNAALRFQPSCLVLTLETIILLSRHLSTINVFESLSPLLRGVQRLHNEHNYNDYKSPQRTGGEFFGAFGRVLSRLYSPDMRLGIDTAMCLFVGRTLKDLGKDGQKICAISDGGICIYLDVLREVSDDRQMVRMVHVVPGQIEYNGKPFVLVRDWQPLLSNWPELHDAHLAVLSDQTQMHQVSLSVHETVRDLAVHYRILDEAGNDTGKTLSPTRVVKDAIFRRGKIHCDHWHYDSEQEFSSKQFDPAFHDILKESGMQYTILRAPIFGRCVALTRAPPDFTLLLRDHECLQCYLKYGINKKARRMMVVCK